MLKSSTSATINTDYGIGNSTNGINVKVNKMARYDHKCNKCEFIWEVTCPMSESSIVRECPSCTSSDTQKYFGPDSGFNFGGGGGGLTPKKVPEGFKDVLRNIKQNTIGGNKMQSSVI